MDTSVVKSSTTTTNPYFSTRGMLLKIQRAIFVFLTKQGGLLFVSKLMANLFSNITARGLCADATSHFIAADPWNNLLHYISSCGELVYYLKYDSMDSPMGLSCNYDRKNSFLICEVSGSIYHVELE